MRTKRIYIVLTFCTTTDAMEAEELSHELDLSGRLIPVPTQISAGCGLALRLLPEDYEIFASKSRSGLWEKATELLL